MAQRRGRNTDRNAGRHAGGSRSAGARPARGAAGPARGGPAPSDLNAQRARLREIVDPVVSAQGYDVDGLALSRAGRRHLVRLTIDGDDGVSLDAVAAVSRAVSAALDAAEAERGELFAGEYELQVSSPGVDRPLTQPRHWRRNVGRLVQVRAGDRQLTGRIVDAGDAGVTLEVGGAPREFSHDELGAGRIQVEFARLAALPDADLEDMSDPLDDGDAIDDDAGDGEQEEDEE
jgi:ribosome maturation factor RimP